MYHKFRKNMRTLRLRASFPSCLHRKVGDERTIKRALEMQMGDFPLQILESRRQERLAELKAECLDLKHQLSDDGLEGKNKQARVLAGQHSKSMHELRRVPERSVSLDESMRRRREERLQTLRRELEQFAIKYSIGEYSAKIEGLDNSMKSTLRKSASETLICLSSPVSSLLPLGSQDVAVGVLLRIQRQREQELQRARMELKHLAFRLKHKLDEENSKETVS